MVGVWSIHAKPFLYVLAIATMLGFSAPIALAPMRWARLVGWVIPEETGLAIYFGRCLGAIAFALDLTILRVAATGGGLVPLFELLTMVWIGMIIVHVVGAYQRVQPLFETLEIGFWTLLLLLTAAFWPSALAV